MKHLPNLLIVDDSEENLDLLEKVIKKVNVNLIKALSGQEALEKTRGIDLPLAIIDVRMPGMNGYELALKMNEERPGATVPVIFLTASHVDQKQIGQGYGVGAVDYIFKPVDSQTLLSKINVFLDLFNQKQTIARDAVLLKKSANKLALALIKAEVTTQKYKTLLNASPDGILLIDMKGIITEASEIGLQLLGADSKDGLVGKNVFRFVPFDEKNAVKNIIEMTTNEGLAQNIELKIRKINQSVFPGEISATLMQDPDGVPLSFMIIVRDISQRKKIEAKQIHADRMSTLGEMASGIAHEINQPLNIISLIVDKILFESAKADTIDIEFIRNKSDKIFENITRVKNIIDHIRAFSRSHDDYISIAFDINSSIENAASMLAEQFKYLGINLIIQLEKHIPLILGNTFKFEQVIINLLVNAKDAVMEKKSKQEEYFDMITGIRSYTENQLIIIEVTDNGIGISNDDIHNIMLPFYTTKDEGKGTGLGLSICYQIIKEMNGSIEISSDPAHGTKIKLGMDIENLSNNVSTR
jgi:PAS domain S-box-containing protein